MKGLEQYWPWILAAVILLALLILIALVRLLWIERKKTAAPKPDADAAPAQPPHSEALTKIGSAFRRARAELSRRGAGDRYSTALAVLLGAEGSRDPGFLHHTTGTAMQLHDDPVGAGLALAGGREFLFFERGAVLDVAGEPVLGSDGEHADNGTWRRILRELVELRPKRPADAVVVTISYVDLSSAVANDAERLALAQRATRVRKRLWELEERCGFRLPLYVLVTSCQLIEGFDETCAALPEAARGQMLGWSSPYGISVPYQTTWIDETFRALRSDLADLQMELFRAGPQPPGVLLFPSALARIAEPLRTYLDHLLSPGARHDSSLTRGIYFCGTAQGKATAFATDLFAKKIFHEVGLATPASGLRTTRSRRARALKLATAMTALAVAAALGFGWWTLRERHDVLADVLNTIHAQMNVDDSQLDEAAVKLITQMPRLQFQHYSPLYLPASIVTGFDHKLYHALGRAFEEIVLKAAHHRLTMAAADLLEKKKAEKDDTPVVETSQAAMGDPCLALTATLQSQPVEQMPAFARLKDFVDRLTELERQGARFNEIATVGSGDAETLDAIVQYAFEKKIPRAFRDSPMFENAVRWMTTDARFTLHEGEAQYYARRDVKALYAQVFEHSALEQRARMIASLVQPSQQTSAYRAPGVHCFETLDGAIQQLRTDLADPHSEWIFRPKLHLGAPFDEVLAAMRRSNVFGAKLAGEIREDGEKRLHELQRRLAATMTAGAPILKLHADGTPSTELSHTTQLLQGGVKRFLGEKFSAPQTNVLSIRSPDVTERLTWDGAAIDNAAAIYREYADFRERGMKLFPANLPPDVTAAIERTAQHGTQRELHDALARAQRFERLPKNAALTEEDLHAEAMTFEHSAKAIRSQLEALRSVGALPARMGVIAAMSAEAMRLLRALTASVEAASPYVPQSFESWDGRTPPAPGGWGARDAGELAEYLDTTRNRIAVASADAAPMLAWFADYGLPANPYDARIVRQWRSIAEDLSSFAAKKPGNGPALLEDYIAVRAAKLTPADCKAAELKSSEREARGYFADKLRVNEKRLLAQCESLAIDFVWKDYNELAQLFNSRLATRYPFNGRAPKKGDPEAHPDDVRRFFRAYDKLRPLLKNEGDDALANALAETRDFTGKMDEVRKFFAPFLEAKTPTLLPQLKVEPAFRIPIKGENTGEIIEWSLKVGNDVATQRKAAQLQWHPGEPVELRVRWATDAPRVPVLRGDESHASIDDRTVVYRYTNTWSLLTALTDLRSPIDDLPNGSDDQPVTLQLIVPTKPAEGGHPDLQHPSRVFLRVAISGLEGQPLDIPREFPDSAPMLNHAAAAVKP